MNDMARFLRWRLKPVRWAEKGINTLADLPRRGRATAALPPASPLSEAMDRDGYAKLDRTIDIPVLDTAALAGTAQGAAFIDVTPRYREAVTTAFLDLLADPATAGMIMRYFNGRPWLWNVALNYSEAMDAATDSQLWHFDYGDTRQLHLLVYFSDVTEQSGPFTFLPAPCSDRVVRHPLVIERFTDEDLARKFAIDATTSTIRLTGRKGEVFASDPGRLLHQGARCALPRLVMFVSFTTPAPMSRGGRATISPAERQRLGRAYAERSGHAAILPASVFS